MFRGRKPKARRLSSYTKKDGDCDDSNPFVDFKVYLPRATLDILREIARKTDIKISRLIALAVDNELDVEEPFNYPITMPTDKHIELQYISEIMKLKTFLETMPRGITLQSLVLCRRNLGIPDRTTFMRVYREALASGFIEEWLSKDESEGILVMFKDQNENDPIVPDLSRYVKKVRIEE